MFKEIFFFDKLYITEIFHKVSTAKHSSSLMKKKTNNKNVMITFFTRIISINFFASVKIKQFIIIYPGTQKCVNLSWILLL